MQYCVTFKAKQSQWRLWKCRQTNNKELLKHVNWCAFVVPRTVSCVVEDGVETYVKPDYQPCAWGTGQCSRVVSYRTYMRPRYKVAYKMVTEMEWKCCQGFSGDDCNTPPAGGTGVVPGHNGNHNYGRGDSERVRRLEDQIQKLTKNLQDLQTNMNRPAGGSGGRNPADAAQPEITETINSIQTKLDQLDNRTQAHDKTLVSINNHLVNGKGNDVDGGVSGGASGPVLTSLKEEILRELERRVSLSCSACQAGVEDLRRQQLEDRERIRALEKQLNALDSRHRQNQDALRRDLNRVQSCCSNLQDLQNRVSNVERKITTTSENLDNLQNQLHNEHGGQEGGNNFGITQGGDNQQVSVLLKNFERHVNNTLRQQQQPSQMDCLESVNSHPLY
uniref:EMI domain-containing protein n=1 Tax=Periophthalmus magnuspinnatus TaxID=409849 RepID=A0A3B4BFT5_9GOBI